MNVIQYATNKYGEFIPYEVRPALYAGGVITARKEDVPAHEGFLGFGVAITGSSCYNLNKMPPQERKEILESIYGKKGLGLKVARLTIGSSDYSAELYTYDDVDGDMELNHFSIERDLEYIIPVIKEILTICPELYLFASPWSPPGWMKTGGSVCGGYMREKYVECYAEYFVKYLKAYAEQGIHIKAITPQNEPETQQEGLMPACIWHPDIEAKFIATLKKKLLENKLDTQIWMYDHAFSGSDRVDWTLTEYEKLQYESDGIAFHYYSGNIEQTVYLKDKYPMLKLHFTEAGPRLFDHYDTDWCKWAIMMSKTINNRYSSFTGWNLMLDETGGPNIGKFFCGGLVTRNRFTNELSYSGQYKAFKHFTAFVNEESKIYPVHFEKSDERMHAFNDGRKPLTGSVVENKNGTSALIMVNPNSNKAQIQFYHNNKWWYIELLPETVATICFEE